MGLSVGSDDLRSQDEAARLDIDGSLYEQLSARLSLLVEENSTNHCWTVCQLEMISRISVT